MPDNWLTPFESRRLESITSRFEKDISNLANARLFRLATWFRDTFTDRHELRIRFGNGDELVTINEVPIWELADRDPAIGYKDGFLGSRRNHVKCLIPLAEAIIDVNEITDGYTRGCPGDIRVRGEKNRWKR